MRKGLVAVGVVLVILGVLDTIENERLGTMGFRMDGTHRVTAVDPNAAQAGVRVGDVLTHIDTADVNARQEFRADPLAGTTRPYTFVRDGQSFRVDIRHEPVSRRAKVLARVATLAGVLFLAFPLWAAQRNPAAMPLAIFGVGFGAAILGAPDRQSNELALFVFNASWFAAIVGSAGLVHFLAVFPSPIRLLSRPYGVAALYAPVAVVVVEHLIALLVGDPLAEVLGATWFLSLFAYLLGGSVLLVHRFRKGKDDGGRRIVVAVVAIAALLPVYAALRLLPAVAGVEVLPPWDYFALFALTGVPVVLGLLAARSSAHAGVGARDSAPKGAAV